MSGKGPLCGIRVIDLTNALAGPFCTMLLADQGAEVIKVERVGVGDDTRHQPNPVVGGENTAFLATNRNKKSIEVNIKRAEGAAVVGALVRTADVLVQSFRPGKLDKLGLGWETVHESNQKLVYCSISGWGGDGPYASRAGYASSAEAVGGLMSVTGAREGPGVKVGVSIIDNLTGLYAKDAITSALYSRAKSGEGQHVEVSLLESTVSILSMSAYSYLLAGLIPGRLGSEHPFVVPWRAFATADGEVVICAANDVQWRHACSALGAEELGMDERFVTGRLRSENRTELYKLMEGILRERSSGYWIAAFEKAGATAVPVNSVDAVFEDPQVLHRNMLLSVRHSTLGDIPQVGHAQKFSSTPCEIRLPPPVLGAHTGEVLREVLGTSEREIVWLREIGAIG